MGKPPCMVDIMPEISGVDFDKTWKKRVTVTVDVKSGLKAFFISGDDLIAAKLSSGRPVDLADVAAMRESRKAKARKRK